MTTLQETQNRISVPTISKKEIVTAKQLDEQNKEKIEENTLTETRTVETVISSIDKNSKIEEVTSNTINSLEVTKIQEQETKTEELSVKKDLKQKKENEINEYKDFLDKLHDKGSLTLSNTLMQGLSIISELVFARLRLEEQHAIEKNYLTEDNLFAIDVEEIAYHLGLSIDLIENTIINLGQRKLIEGKSINDYNFVKINKENTLNFVKSLEEQEPEYKQYKKLSAVQREALKGKETKE